VGAISLGMTDDPWITETPAGGLLSPETMEKLRAAWQQGLWFWGWETYYENELLMREIIEQAEEEMFFAWGL